MDATVGIPAARLRRALAQSDRKYYVLGDKLRCQEVRINANHHYHYYNLLSLIIDIVINNY